MLVNERIPPGTVLVIDGKEEIEGKWRRTRRRYNAVKQYRHHVMVVNSRGSISCITHAELFQSGLVTQRAEDIPAWALNEEPRRRRGCPPGKHMKGAKK